MTKKHPAQWECEWITANGHRYQNPLPNEQVKRRIITRTSFQRGALLRDLALFETAPGWIGKSFQSGTDKDYSADIVKRIHITDKDPDLDVTGYITLMFPNEKETFKQLVERYSCIAKKYASLEEIFKDYHIRKEYSINRAVVQIAQEEIEENAVFFMSQGSWGMVVTAVFKIEQIATIYQFTVE